MGGFGLGAHKSSLNLTFPVKSIRVSGSDSWRFLQLSWNDIELLTFLTSSHCSIPRGSGPKCEAKNWTFTKTDNLKSQNFNYLEAEQPCQTLARPGSFHCWIPAPGHLLVCIAHLVQDDNEDSHSIQWWFLAPLSERWSSREVVQWSRPIHF